MLHKGQQVQTVHVYYCCMFVHVFYEKKGFRKGCGMAPFLNKSDVKLNFELKIAPIVIA